MNQASFVDKNEPFWTEFSELLDEFDQDYLSVPPELFPQKYRKLCQHLSIAHHRGYGASVVDRLNPLVERGHALLYASRTGRWRPLLEYIGGGFARDVRRDWPLLVIALVLFVGPLAGMIVWLGAEPQWAYHVLGDDIISSMEKMYASADAVHAQRQADSNLMMFGFYIRHNIGIGLRTFGSGLIAGLGACVALFYNGTVLGGIAGHLNNVGLGHNFWPFAIGHGAFELPAIVLSGMAGLKLGFAPIWPGRKSRLQSLKDTARDSVGLVGGVFTMFVIAAFIEGFWSASPVEPMFKYIVGASLWAVVILYFCFAGRR